MTSTPKPNPNMFVLTGVTAAQIAALTKTVIASGSRMQQVAGIATKEQYEINGHNIQALASYEPATGDLTVTVQKKPFYVSINDIEKGIEKEMGEASAPLGEKYPDTSLPFTGKITDPPFPAPIPAGGPTPIVGGPAPLKPPPAK